MKTLMSIVVFVLTLTLSVNNVFAVDPILSGHESDPRFIVYYGSGLHGIVGEEGTAHQGEDLIIRVDDTLSFYQWFYGTSPTEGLHGEFSHWVNKRGPSCFEGYIEVRNAYEQWGSYLASGDYCVKTTQFDASSIPYL